MATLDGKIYAIGAVLQKDLFLTPLGTITRT